MENTTLEQLKYPIGQFVAPEFYTENIISTAIKTIETFPQKLKAEVENLSQSQLETQYRPDGWTIRQVIHHCADSHMNCFIRLKWTLTEATPTIKFYYENLWAEGIDNKTMDIQPTLEFLSGLHYRLAFVMTNLTNDELEKSFIHPEHNKQIKLKELICMYAWHCNHHLAHITELKKRKNWD